MAIRATRRRGSLSIADSTAAPPANGLSWLIEGVILSWGWRRRAIAFFSGATGALALPPLSLFPLIAVPLIIAVWLIDGAQERGSGRSIAASLSAAFGAGWWMGFGYFLASLWWVGSALLVEADKFAWALPLAVVALPAALAVFPAAGFVLARLLWSPGSLRIFALAFGLGAAEWARGTSVQRFSMERPRDGAWRQSCARSDRFARRPARAYLPNDRDLRSARDAVARERKPPHPGADYHRGACARVNRGFRRVPADGPGQRHASRGETAADSAQRRSGRRVVQPG